jgi:SOS-response transcriptional repressor LexA
MMNTKKAPRIERSGFINRLNTALDKEGFPPKNRGRIQLLADLMGLSHRGAGKWLDGETVPPAKKCPFLAEKLHVNAEWLRTGKGNMVRESASHDGQPPSIISKEVPLYTMTDLNNPYRTPEQMVTCYVFSTGRIFGVKIDTEAMSPRIPAGSIILVDIDRKPKDGDFVLAQMDRLPGPQFRQLMLMNETKYLMADNPRFERLTVNPNDKILGVVIQTILLFY